MLFGLQLVGIVHQPIRLMGTVVRSYSDSLFTLSPHIQDLMYIYCTCHAPYTRTFKRPEELTLLLLKVVKSYQLLQYYYFLKYFTTLKQIYLIWDVIL